MHYTLSFRILSNIAYMSATGPAVYLCKRAVAGREAAGAPPMYHVSCRLAISGDCTDTVTKYEPYLAAIPATRPLIVTDTTAADCCRTHGHRDD